MSRQTVAVIGGGCSGVLAARELLRTPDVEVLLVEPGEVGGGVAYGMAKPWHLLNSRAGAMSADPADPGHFARWAGVAPQDFAPRPTYGRYLRSVLDEAAAAAGPDRLRVIAARAVAVRSTVAHGTEAGRGGGREMAVVLADGWEIRADQVVLAVGSPAGAQPAAVPEEIRAHPAYVADPWRPGVLDALPNDRPVLLIGTGLTAVDVALTLTVDQQRTVVAVSRRGLLPLSHTVTAAPPRRPALDDCTSLRDVIRAVRAAAGEAGDWRAVVDGLRPDLDRLWVAMTPAEQAAFLRHLARPWECHRHRMAPAVAERITALREAGRLTVRAGGLRGITPAADGGLAVELSGGRIAVGAVVNCAGPGLLPAAAGSLAAGLLADGAARVGPHGLGLDIDDAGRLIGADGRTRGRVWVLGPLRRGARWETTAVPEIRDQAARLARDLAPAAEPALEAVA